MSDFLDKACDELNVVEERLCKLCQEMSQDAEDANVFNAAIAMTCMSLYAQALSRLPRAEMSETIMITQVGFGGRLLEEMKERRGL